MRALGNGFALDRGDDDVAVDAEPGAGQDQDERADDGPDVVLAEAAAGFLAENGWRIDPASCETERVTIPEQFNAVYERYNALQLAQGFDLTPYRGQPADRYSFTVVDYGVCEDGGLIRANVLFAGDTIIAADICSTALHGFIHGVMR